MRAVLKGSATVFVVDDESASRDSIIRMVRLMGFRTTGFATGEQFLSSGSHSEPGCVVTDLRMPGMNGIAMLKAMRQSGSSMPLILVTAYADVPSAIEAMDHGAMTFLEKPYRDQVLWDSIVRALHKDQENRENESCRSSLLSQIKNLTGEEQQIIEMLVRNVPNKLIGKRLDVSLRTINHRRTEILKKLEMDSMASLIWHLGKAGWPSPQYDGI